MSPPVTDENPEIKRLTVIELVSRRIESRSPESRPIFLLEGSLNDSFSHPLSPL